MQDKRKSKHDSQLIWSLWSPNFTTKAQHNVCSLMANEGKSSPARKKTSFCHSYLNRACSWVSVKSKNNSSDFLFYIYFLSISGFFLTSSIIHSLFSHTHFSLSFKEKNYKSKRRGAQSTHATHAHNQYKQHLCLKTVSMMHEQKLVRGTTGQRCTRWICVCFVVATIFTYNKRQA